MMVGFNDAHIYIYVTHCGYMGPHNQSHIFAYIAYYRILIKERVSTKTIFR